MGRTHPDRLLEELTPREFDEWIAYHELEAWGDEHRQDAKFVAAIYNSQGGKKNGQAYKPDDFLPQKRPAAAGDAEQALHIQHWKMYAAQVKAKSEGPGQKRKRP